MKLSVVFNESCFRRDLAMTNQFSSYQKEQIASLSKEEKGISQILRTLDSEGRKTSCATVRKWVNWWEKKRWNTQLALLWTTKQDYS